MSTYNTTQHKHNTSQHATHKHRKLIWMMRHSLARSPKLLIRFLQGIDWANEDMKMEAYRMFDLWAPPSELADLLQLLDVSVPDYSIRARV